MPPAGDSLAVMLLRYANVVVVCALVACDRPSVPAEPVPARSATRPAGSAVESASPSPPGPSRPARSPAFEGTAGIVERHYEDRPVATLRAVRTARHDGFDRAVFEFSGKVTPGYHVEYIDKPVRRCGSGEATAVAGDGWLAIRMTPAAAHDEVGHPTLRERERALDLPILREAELTCDFEAVVTWVLGTASPNHYRVLELTDPPRLVVDVRHAR